MKKVTFLDRLKDKATNFAQELKNDLLGDAPKQPTSNNPANPPAPATPSTHYPTTVVNEKTYKVTGMEYHMDSLLALACENDEYRASKNEIIEYGMEDQRIYEREFYPIKTELIPEPDNPYDSNAIRVVVDGQHVGYIKKGSCAHLLKLLQENRIERINCEIKGGRYKIVFEDEDDAGNTKYRIEKSEAPYSVHLKIVEK